MDDLQAKRLAANEALARDVNERVGEVSEAWYAEQEPLEFICECSHETCFERVHVTMTDYRQVRDNALRFFLVEGHVLPEIERIVGRAGDAVVVEKTGPGRDVAEATAD